MARASVVSPVWWLYRAVRFSGRERQGLIRAAKMALAAVIAWLLARSLPAPQSFIAPYAAVFLMVDTVYRSMAEAIRQAVALVLGVLLAYLSITVLGRPVIALAVAVFVGMLIGAWNRLGDSGVWVGVTALLMLTYGTAGQRGYLVVRVAQTLIGSAVGVAVNMLVLPPTYLRETRWAVATASERIRGLSCSMARELRGDWGEATARSWLRRARSVDRAVRRAESAIEWARESTWFNPRWLLVHRWRRVPVPSAFEPSMSTLGEVSTQLQRLAEALVAGDGRPGPGHGFSEEIGALLESLAKVVSCYRFPLDGDCLTELAGHLDEAVNRHAELAEKLRDGEFGATGPHTAESAALLALQRAFRALTEDQYSRSR